MFITAKSFQGFIVSGLPIFYMVPFAFSTYLCFGIVLVSSFIFLWKREEKFDLILVSGSQTGVVLGAITIIVGMIWSQAEWGYFWQWDPRQTATLIMWLVYVGLLIFREMEENQERKGIISAVFGIAAAASIPLSLFAVSPLHNEFAETSLGPGSGLYLMLNFVFAGGISLMLVYTAYRVNKIDLKLKKIRKIKMEEA